MRLILLLCLLLIAPGTSRANETILQAQTRLARMGFYQGEIDGRYGSQTAAAIRRFQISENLPVNGKLTPETLRRLGIHQNPPTFSSATEQRFTDIPAHVAIANLFKGGPMILAGPELQIAAIRQAQKNLRLLGYFSGPIDGIPTPSLVEALKAWQRDAGFRPTGRFDSNTLRGLDIISD